MKSNVHDALDPHKDARELSREPSPKSWREPLALYALMTLITVLIGALQGSVALLAGYGALLSALAFIYLPTWLIERRGEDPRDFGLHVGTVARSTLNALKVSALVLPFYVVGYHVWQTTQDRPLHLDTQALSRWDEPLRGRPEVPLQRGELRLFAERDELTLQWWLKPGERAFSAKLTGYAEARVLARGRSIKLTRPTPHEAQTRAQTRAQSNPSQGALEVSGGGRGHLTLRSPTLKLAYELYIDGEPVSAARLKLGALMSSPSHPSLARGEAERSWWWLLLTLATQLLLVAIPEEVFYRGYLQTRLDALVGHDRALFGARVNLKSLTLTSLLFALAHLATVPHPARLAVFFPSLLFGWMRRAYHNTLTPAIFHALCNVLAQLLWGLYLPR